MAASLTSLDNLLFDAQIKKLDRATRIEYRDEIIQQISTLGSQRSVCYNKLKIIENVDFFNEGFYYLQMKNDFAKDDVPVERIEPDVSYFDDVQITKYTNCDFYTKLKFMIKEGTSREFDYSREITNPKSWYTMATEEDLNEWFKEVEIIAEGIARKKLKTYETGIVENEYYDLVNNGDEEDEIKIARDFTMAILVKPLNTAYSSFIKNDFFPYSDWDALVDDENLFI